MLLRTKLIQTKAFSSLSEQKAVFKMALLLVLLCMSLVIVKGEGSHCMATTCGAQHGLSLYLRVYCVNSNLGQTVKMRENNSNKYILCPSVRPRSCPPGKLNCHYV